MDASAYFRESAPAIVSWIALIGLCLAAAQLWNGLRNSGDFLVLLGSEPAEQSAQALPPTAHGPSRQTLLLFGEISTPPVEPIARGANQTAFEPVALVGVIWIRSSLESRAVIRLRGASVLGQVGSALPDGSMIEEIGQNYVDLRRGNARVRVHQPHGTIDLTANPFQFARAALVSGGRRRQVADEAPSAGEVIRALEELRAATLPVAVPTVARPATLRRRVPGQTAESDAGYQRLRQLQPETDG